MPREWRCSFTDSGISMRVPSAFTKRPSRQKNSRPVSVMKCPSPRYLYHSTLPSTMGRGMPSYSGVPGPWLSEPVKTVVLEEAGAAGGSVESVVEGAEVAVGSS
jgi:hypothetical protein